MATMAMTPALVPFRRRRQRSVRLPAPSGPSFCATGYRAVRLRKRGNAGAPFAWKRSTGNISQPLGVISCVDDA